MHKEAIAKLSDSEQEVLLGFMSALSEKGFRRGLQQGVTFAHAGEKIGLNKGSLEQACSDLRFNKPENAPYEVFENFPNMGGWGVIPSLQFTTIQDRLVTEEKNALIEFGFDADLINELYFRAIL